MHNSFMLMEVDGLKVEMVIGQGGNRCFVKWSFLLKVSLSRSRSSSLFLMFVCVCVYCFGNVRMLNHYARLNDNN